MNPLENIYNPCRATKTQRVWGARAHSVFPLLSHWFLTLKSAWVSERDDAAI